ncbi:polysaccharide biosynthesis protein GumK [Sphingomonas yantingensis]|uniref:2-beta-glucuronyltransferase n=1 Tax=Sphingomonas yantingensis TaxID=1241761 RepID=A0A7W9ARL9_9SPHN|nr:polysaccharide biosynthesis protein GumK [Sphingomonas yantingensis]MBB5699303.1 2-beta-glucuronyltransferase [Sphingomonas yantingensis]
MNKGNVVFISAFHDYRTAKRASIHQIAHALARSGYAVSFLSTRFSRLSRSKGDSRLNLWERANRIEMVDGIGCYLWRTHLHPFATGNALADRLMGPLFRLYARLPNRDVDALLAAADHVVVEASVAAILLRRIRRLNPTARIIYYATDRLATVGAHPFVQAQLARDAGLIHHVSMRSWLMAPDFAWASDRLTRIGFGIDPADFANIGPSPYPAGTRNAVSVGSMLFDERFFHHAAAAFPDVVFHVIGCGRRFTAAANVVVHDEMPFRDTLPYIAHATIGIAPYVNAPGVEYLADTSLKLAQFEYLGLPAVCPDFAAGDVASRSPYHPDQPASIERAVAIALAAAGTIKPRSFPRWEEIGERLLHPERYSDTARP